MKYLLSVMSLSLVAFTPSFSEATSTPVPVKLDPGNASKCERTGVNNPVCGLEDFDISKKIDDIEWHSLGNFDSDGEFDQINYDNKSYNIYEGDTVKVTPKSYNRSTPCPNFPRRGKEFQVGKPNDDEFFLLDTSGTCLAN